MLPSFRGGWPAAGIGLLLLFPLSSPDAFLLDVFTTGFLLAAFAASWDVVGGVSGQITLGHALPFGAAAYACALLTSLAGWPLPLAVAAAVSKISLASFSAVFFHIVWHIMLINNGAINYLGVGFITLE